jgi:hypothetical protein
MSDSQEWLWGQAARFFSMAEKARENGDTKLDNILTQAARRCLDRLAERERVDQESFRGPAVEVH